MDQIHQVWAPIWPWETESIVAASFGEWDRPVNSLMQKEELPWARRRTAGFGGILAVRRGMTGCREHRSECRS
jgi:hypothetical protein